MRMGHESMKKTWERRKSCTQEKRTTIAEAAKIRHFPLAPIFRRLGARAAHPQGRSISEGRVALAERCAGGLPTDNQRDRGSRRREPVRCGHCRKKRQWSGWYCRFFRQWQLALTSPQPVLQELLINGVGAVIRKLDKDVPGGCLQRVAIVAE